MYGEEVFDNAVEVTASDSMTAAIACLGGEMKWEGQVRGLFGLLKRNFTIESQGRRNGDTLSFFETLRFDDGEVQKREWNLKDSSSGLLIEGENVKPLAPGSLSGDALEISYKIKLGPIWFSYLDRFEICETGDTENIGIASLFSIPLMKITARGRRV
jgi:hypothetical protein